MLVYWKNIWPPPIRKRFDSVTKLHIAWVGDDLSFHNFASLKKRYLFRFIFPENGFLDLKKMALGEEGTHPALTRIIASSILAAPSTIRVHKNATSGMDGKNDADDIN